MSAEPQSPTAGSSPEPPGRPLKVKRALLSVSDKTGIADFARGLAELGVEIVSTGGTESALREAGIAVRGVEELTGFPEILDGRVKTLHPHLHAALLAKRENPEHVETLRERGIEEIDLVAVNLYPFERTVSRQGVPDSEIIENIDIGGPTMIRAAAKNHEHVAVLVRPESYDAVLAEMDESGGEVSATTRHWLANEAFALTARYDAVISRWFSSKYEAFPTHWVSSWTKLMDLSYGENPHQRAALYVDSGSRSHVLSRTAKLHGKPLSFNNVLDLDSARRLLGDLEGPACVIVKHTNPCGAASGATVAEAYGKALACDPMSAFGGIVALNRPVTLELAERLHESFIEVLIAPAFEEGALEKLQEKEAIRILEDSEQRAVENDRDIKRVRGGILIQDQDGPPEPRELMEVVTEAEPSDQQWRDLLFAWAVVRLVRSNAIVLAKDGATVGVGAGQMSRVDSVRLAVEKCRDARGEESTAALAGSAMASDAFFPFDDGPQSAIEAGVTSVIQPGGSKRDADVIAACDAAGIPMVFTRSRHFRH